MYKRILCIAALTALLCMATMYAQDRVNRVLTIEEMFALADKNSKSLRPAATGIEEAHETLKSAQSARTPDIDASLSFSYIGNGYLIERDFSAATFASMPHFGNNFALKVSQILYAGGEINSAVEIAKLGEESAELTLEESRDKLRLMLIGYYLDLFKQHNLLKVYEKNIAQTQELLDEIRAKSQEGLALKNDETRYELMLANMKLAHTQIANSITVMNDNIVTILGLPPETNVEPDSTLLATSMPIETKEHWTDEAGNATQLQQIAVSAKISEAETRAARSAMLPKIAFVAANNFDGPILIEVPPINQNFNYWYAGVGITYNFGSLYKSNKEYRKKKIAARRMSETYADALEQKELAVRADYIKYIETYDELHTQEKSVELAEQNYAVVRSRYMNDMALITDMLDASNTKLAAETGLTNARINIIYRYYILLFAVGRI